MENVGKSNANRFECAIKVFTGKIRFNPFTFQLAEKINKVLIGVGKPKQITKYSFCENQVWKDFLCGKPFCYYLIRWWAAREVWCWHVVFWKNCGFQ